MTRAEAHRRALSELRHRSVGAGFRTGRMHGNLHALRSAHFERGEVTSVLPRGPFTGKQLVGAAAVLGVSYLFGRWLGQKLKSHHARGLDALS